MPYLKIQTNIEREPGDSQPVLARASKLIAEQLGKPEKYVMVALETAVPLAFGGSEAPTAYLELKSIGLPQEKTTELSQALCALIHDEFGVKPERVYIEFADAPGAMWGWNSGTF
jgi:phenylpyruvate tautomerase PptA (4-oxalocrotonate tautomerase family)